MGKNHNVIPGSIYGNQLRSMDAVSRRKMILKKHYGASKGFEAPEAKLEKSDLDVLKEEWKFVRSEEDNDDSSWQKRMAKNYYKQLFKEYCLADLSLYTQGKIALRWRMEKELVEGKGQFICGNKKCSNSDSLRSWEVNFAYVEDGEKKNALVKLRLCPDCSVKLNYQKQNKIATKKDLPLEDSSSDSSDSNSSSDSGESDDENEKESSKKRSRGKSKAKEKGKEKEKEKDKDRKSRKHKKQKTEEKAGREIEKLVAELLE